VVASTTNASTGILLSQVNNHRTDHCYTYTRAVCLNRTKRLPTIILPVLVAGLLIMGMSLQLPAQERGELTTDSRRARRAYERAEEAYLRYNRGQALIELSDAVDRDPEFIEAHLLMAEIYFAGENYAESIAPYRNAVEIDPAFFPPAGFYLGKALYRTGEYKEARERLQAFYLRDDVSSALKVRAENLLKRCDFAIEAMAEPVAFTPENPGPAINSRLAEYSPALTADEMTLIFTREKPRESERGGTIMFEDFYISHFRNGEWTEAVNMGPPLNTRGNEGAQSITADGRHLYFTACNRSDGVGSCDIYYSRLEGGKWSRPVNPGRPLNSSAWDSQPSVSADGQTLFFASSRDGNLGQMDIWKATRNEAGVWNEPQNLGPVINTSGREMSPFIHPDNQTLYFASDGHIGMGGLDIFYSRKDENGSWTEPVNLGYPINTHADEFGMIVGASGKTAWFSSDMEGGYGESDLYTFTLYEEARPRPVTYMKGRVTDSESGDPLGADFEVSDVQNGRTLAASTADPVDGSFLVSIPTDRDLALNVSMTGYLFFSEHFSYEGVRTVVEPHLRDIALQPVQEGAAVVLRNIFFETDHYALQEASYHELERLRRFMEDNPDVFVEIRGHTDSTGSFAHNMELSENRARSVYSYLTEQGISPDRLSFKGFADTMPLDTNETAEGRAKNRRTEFRVISGN